MPATAENLDTEQIVSALGAHSLRVARQPIFDRDRRLFAYELLYRPEGEAASITGEQATHSVLVSAHLDMGFDQIAGDARVFVNFTEETLLSQLPKSFPADKLVVELLETVEPTPQLVEACRLLRSHGYTLALDDFEYQRRFEPLLALCSLVKLDLQKSSPDELTATTEYLRSRGHTLLA